MALTTLQHKGKMRSAVMLMFLCTFGIRIASGQNIPPPRPMASLKTVPVPEPSNLDDFVKDRDAAIMLGKALFWDMQVGSDGKTACASCHWHAGADQRFANSLAPPKALFDAGQPLNNPLSTLRKRDFPFIKRENPDPNDPTDPFLNPDSKIVSNLNEVLGSQGVQSKQFNNIRVWSAKESGYPVYDPVFSVHGTNLRTVTSRNSPSVINAVFNHRQNWNGGSSFYFNGVNDKGKFDTGARVYESRKSYKTTYKWVREKFFFWWRWTKKKVTVSEDSLEEVSVLLDNASLASQAVIPPTMTEMAFIDRPFQELGRKMLYLRPLAKQQVYFTDSVLSPYSIYFGKGLWIDYRTLIRRAFHDKWWNSKAATNDGYTQMEANFSLYWGIALQMYQATLVSDETPLDRFLDGDSSALSELAQVGKFIFEGNGNPAGGCNICHSGPELTAAAVGEIVQPDGNQLQVSIMTRRAPGEEPSFTQPFDVPTFYDRGFYNLGVSRTVDDIASGEVDEFGPLSPTKRALQGDDIGQSGQVYDLAVQNAFPIAVDGTFKAPGLRNVELTGPYFHNGGRLNLEDVVKFYARGSDFNLENGSNLDQGVSGIPPLRDPARGGVPALVEFLKSLTDDRVRYQSEQFDHPELFLPNGFVRASGDELIENTLRVPAVGRYGVWARFWGTIDGKQFVPADHVLNW